MTPEITIQIASLPDREEVVAELWYGNVQLAELSQEEGKLTLEIYPNPTGEPWTFQFNELVEMLEQARRKLVGY